MCSSDLYATLEAEEGRLGVELFLSEKPDAVLIDLRTPDRDGFDVLAELTEHSVGVPFIVISGAGQIEDAIKAIRKGAWDFVIKGESVLPELDQAILKALERATFLKAQQQCLELETEEHQRIEEVLRNQLSFIQTVIDAVPNQIFYKDIDGKYLGSNQAFIDFFGMSKEQILGRQIEEFVPEGEDSFYRGKDQELLAEGGSQEFEFTTLFGGKKHTVLVRKAVFNNLNGEPGGIVGVVTDITRQKTTEQVLRQSEERFRSLLETSPLPIIIADLRKGEIIFANQSGADHFGVDLSEAVGLQSKGFYADSKVRRQLFRLVLKEGHLDNVEVEMVHRDGTHFWTQASAVLMELDERKVVFISFSDITARKSLEEALRKFEFIANATQDLMTLINRDFVYEAVNRAYLNIHDKSEKVILGHSVAGIWGRDLFDKRIRPHLEECFTGHLVSYKAWFSFPDREKLYYEVFMYPYLDQNGQVTHVTSVSRDITESYLAQTRIRSEERRVGKEC